VRDFAEVHADHLQGLLEPDEQLRGVAATTLQLRTTGGDKLKLTLMQGGSGMLGALGGGASQEAGVQALADWFQAHG
jgi:hypothetical protein